MARAVVYTCMFGYSERFNDFHYDRAEGIDFVCFTDDPDLQSSFWEIRRFSEESLDPARFSKNFKHRPHRYFSDYDLSLYIDNTVRLRRSPEAIFQELGSSVFKCFRHPWRQCIYDEAKVVAELSKDDPDRVAAQIAEYRDLGYPENNGLIAATVLLRRHNDGSVAKLGESWHEQILTHSLRDQLSFNFIAWRQQFSPGYFGGDLVNNDLIEWPVVSGRRIPRDFDDMRYLQLNPDVKSSGINPRKHYLHHGMEAGLLYK